MILPIGFIGSVILDFTKKHTKNEKHIFPAFILYNMLFFLLFGLIFGGVVACLGAIRQHRMNADVIGRFLVLVICLFPLLGMVHGLIWWLVFRRNKE